MGKIREVHSPILLRVSLTQSLVFSATQKEKEQKIPHFQLFEQNYLCIKFFFICGLGKWCFITKYWKILWRIIVKRDIRVYRTKINGPMRSLYYAESNTFNILRPL